MQELAASGLECAVTGYVCMVTIARWVAARGGGGGGHGVWH